MYDEYAAHELMHEGIVKLKEVKEVSENSSCDTSNSSEQDRKLRLSQGSGRDFQGIKEMIKNKKLFTIKETIGESVSKKNEQDEDCEAYCLIANDNPFQLTGYKQGLIPHFDRVYTATNGKEAVELVKSHNKSYFSAIILDIDMPVMDGIDACISINQYLNEEEKVPGSVKSSNQSAQSSKVSNQQMKSRIPFCYALTSEIDEAALARMRRAGFKGICK